MSKSSRASMPNKILIVDDEQDILDILTRALGTAGYEVETASNGQVALEKVSLQSYDLIITNIRMPVMDGEAFYRQLCSTYPDLSKRVIFCTGDVANPVTQRFLKATGAPVIFKPFQLNTVLQTVAWELNKDRATAPAPPMLRSNTAIVPAL